MAGDVQCAVSGAYERTPRAHWPIIRESIRAHEKFGQIGEKNNNPGRLGVTSIRAIERTTVTHRQLHNDRLICAVGAEWCFGYDTHARTRYSCLVIFPGRELHYSETLFIVTGKMPSISNGRASVRHVGRVSSGTFVFAALPRALLLLLLGT